MSLNVERVWGLELSGARNRRTHAALLEYYAAKKRLFLLDLIDDLSGDEALLEALGDSSSHALFGLSVPLTLPPCIRCHRSSCPTIPLCEDTDVHWMRTHTASQRAVTPYTQRPVDLWLAQSLTKEERLFVHPHETLSANPAPLTARAHYLKHHLKGTVYEVNARLSLWRLAQNLKMPVKSITLLRDIEKGREMREQFLHRLMKQSGLFIYLKDIPRLVDQLALFDALTIALSTFLAHVGLCDRPPENFPEAAGWIAVPLKKMTLTDVIAG